MIKNALRARPSHIAAIRRLQQSNCNVRGRFPSRAAPLGINGARFRRRYQARAAPRPAPHLAQARDDEHHRHRIEERNALLKQGAAHAFLEVLEVTDAAARLPADRVERREGPGLGSGGIRSRGVVLRGHHPQARVAHEERAVASKDGDGARAHAAVGGQHLGRGYPPRVTCRLHFPARHDEARGAEQAAEPLAGLLCRGIHRPSQRSRARCPASPSNSRHAHA